MDGKKVLKAREIRFEKKNFSRNFAKNPKIFIGDQLMHKTMSLPL